MNNVKKMYTLSVPCKTQFIKDNSVMDISDLPDRLWISPSCVCRISKDSLLIFNGLYQAFYTDGDFSNYFKDGFCFNKKDFEAGEINQLIKKKIIDLTEDGTHQPKVHYYDSCISAYYATLEITQRCNANCAHCYNGLERCDKDPMLETIKQRIIKLKSMGIQYIEVTGGEPLLRDDIEEIISFIKENELKYCIATNGSLISRHKHVILGAESVSISLDGDRDYHNMIRGCDIYDKVIEGLEFLQNNNVRTLISMTVTNENEKYIDHVVGISEKYGAELILAAVVPAGKADALRYSSHKESESAGKSSMKVYGDSLKRPKVEVNKDTYFFGCDMGRKGFTVSIVGNILPCLFMREFSIGRLEDMTIEKYNDIVEKLCTARRKAVKICEDCDNTKCGGLCIFSNSQRARRKKRYDRDVDFCRDIHEII
ncbi:MAG: radical SAM protein [Eubacterium sp.]|nr:radical SAM protein [Eubacterium sp.]